jgi:hypothetical protein
MILRLKEARSGRSGRTRIVVTRTARDALLHGRIDKRSGAFYVESEHLVVEFPAREAVAVWELLKQAFRGRFIEATVGKPRHHDARSRREGKGRPTARGKSGSARLAGASRSTG